MNKFISFARDFYQKFANKRLFWWIVSLFGLGGLYFIARIAEPDSLIVYKELLVLFAVDSFLFFFTDRQSAKMGLLTLVFLATMEVMVTIFYVLSLISLGRV